MLSLVKMRLCIYHGIENERFPSSATHVIVDESVAVIKDWIFSFFGGIQFRFGHVKKGGISKATTSCNFISILKNEKIRSESIASASLII